MNIYEGARRIALLCGGLWATGCVVYAVTSEPYFRIYYAVDWVESPVLIDDCGRDDARKSIEVKAPDGSEVPLVICLVASKASNGKMLIPYASDQSKPGWVQMNEKYSSEVTEYAERYADSFKLPADALPAFKKAKQSAYLEQFKVALQLLLGGIAIGWALTAAIGWIVRGFMGIPKSKDSKPQS